MNTARSYSPLLTIVVLFFAHAGFLAAQSHFEWVKTVSGPTFDESYGMAITTDGHVHIVGTFSDSVRVDTNLLAGLGGYDGFTARFNASGRAVDFDAYGGLMLDEMRSIAADNKGNYYVAGVFEDQALVGGRLIESIQPFEIDMFVAKFDKGGVLLWVNVFGSPDYDEASPYVGVDSLGAVYLAGGFAKTAQFGSRTLTASAGSDVFLCKMSANGDVTWVKRAGGAGHDQALGVAVTPNGDRVYAVGIFNGSADFGDGKPIEAFSQGQDLFVWALTANGDFSFAKRIGTSKNEDHIACFADASGKLLATGAMMGTTVFDNKTLTASSDLYSDVFLCRFEKTGGIDLLKRYGGIYNEVGKAVYVDSRNMIYITGHFDTIATFGGTTVNSNGGRDMFITRLWPNGDVEWVRSGGGEFDDEGTGIAVSSTGVPYVSGTFDTEAYFDGYYVKGDKFTDAFVAAMVCGPNTDIMLNAAELTICEGVDTLLQAQTGYIGYTWKVNGVDVSQAGGGAGFNMGSLTPGKHNVTVEITDVYGCKGTSKTVAVEVLPAPPKPVITRLDNVLGCSIPDMQYQWYLNGVIVAGATSQTMEVRGDGYYRVKVTGDNGCSSWSDNFIIGPSSVPGISGHGVQVWPNPFTDAIEVKGAIGREIIITDMLGREVMRSTAVTDSETVRVVGSVGSYMLIVRNGGEVWTTMVQKR